MKKTLILGLFLSIGLGACGREDIDDNQINVVADPGNGSGTSTSTTDTSTSTAETPTVTGNVEVNDFI